MKCYRQKLLLVAGFFLALSFGSQKSNAFLAIEEAPPLSYDMKTPLEKLNEKMEWHEEKPFGDESLAMKITLPIGWNRYETESIETREVTNEFEKSGGDQGGDIFRLLVRYSTPARIQRRSEFRVRSIEINTLVSLQNWFIELLLQMGFSPEGVTIRSPDRLEAQYTLFEHGEPMVTRAVVERSGNKIILAEYMVHQENYLAEKDEQIKAMQDFHLTNPSKELPVSLKSYAFVDIAKFEYPQSWILYSPGITTIERMEASVINIKGIIDRSLQTMDTLQLNGRIDVTIVSRYADTTIEKEVVLIGQQLKQKELLLSDKMDSVELPKLNDKIIASSLNTYHIIPPVDESLKSNKFSAAKDSQMKLADYECWLAILETQGRYYFIRLLTIGREEDFKSWAENTEVFNVLLTTVAPVNDQIH